MAVSSPHPDNVLVVIAGPTAVGKTDFAVKLAKALNTVVISADSRQFYKEITIGTAKPRQEEMQGVPHYFIDNVSIQQHYSAGMFEKDVISFLEQYFEKNNIAVMCGGSGLYIDAVCNGMDEFDEIDIKLRDLLNQEVKQKGLAWLQSEVKQVDPDYYSIVDKQNPARLQRALEVFRATGQPFSKYRKGTGKKRDFRICKILLDMDRAVLYSRINLRVDKMMQEGLLNEVETVKEYREAKALNTVGYKELFAYLDGKESLERAVELIKQNSRRYAKRQLTWFNNDPRYLRFHPGDFDKVLHFVQEFRNNK